MLDFTPQQTHLSTPCDVNQLSDYEETPLHVACRAGRVDSVRVLQGCCGADLECVDAEGNSFLHCVSLSDSDVLWGWAIDVLNNGMMHLVDKANKVGVRSECVYSHSMSL